MDIALQYNDSYSKTVFSFANKINTLDGGTHLSGFRTALTRTINSAGQQMGLFKDVKENLSGDDVREGLVAVVSVKLPSRTSRDRPRQTQFRHRGHRAGLRRRTGWACSSNRTLPIAKRIINKAIEAARAREAARKARD